MAVLNLALSSNQTAFNNQRGPVLWGHEGHDLAVFTPDKAWVHPTLMAANTVLAAQGKPTIDPVGIANATMSYVNAPKAQRPWHPTLVEDLATRREPFATFDLATVADPAEQTALRELVAAAGFADLYYKVQVEPDFLPQLAAVVAMGDPVLLHHFWFRGHLGSIDPGNGHHAFDFVPGGTRTVNGIWWPADWTAKDIAALRHPDFPWSSDLVRRQVFSPHSRIVEVPLLTPIERDSSPYTCGLSCFDYNGRRYQVVSLNSDPTIRLIAEMMAEHIDRAADALLHSAADYAHMLREIAAGFRSDELFANFDRDMRWVHANHPRLSATFTRGENYAGYGDRFGVKSVMEAVVAYNDPAVAAVAGAVRELVPATHDRLVALWTTADEKPPFDLTTPPYPAIEALNPVFVGGCANSAVAVFGGSTLPNPHQYEKDIPPNKIGKRIVLLANIVRLRVANQGLPLARAVFDETTVQRMERALKNPLAAVLFPLAHEIAHNDGVKLDNDTIAAYGYDRPAGEPISLAQGMEEGKADLNGVFNLPFYFRTLGELLISSEDMHDAVYIYLGNLLRNLLIGPTNDHGVGAVYHWRRLQEAGVISFSGGAYHFNLSSLLAGAGGLTKDYQDLMGSKDAARVQAWHREAMAMVGPDTPIGRGAARVKADGGPSMDRPYYVVMGSDRS